MKREVGFTLIELMVATAIVLVILGTTLGALTSALNATQGITLMADTQENLRAGMNYMVRDFTQAGVGIPQGGITIPANTVVWPGTGGKFPAAWTVLPAISPGYQLGPTTTTSGVASDTVTLLYADNTLQNVNLVTGATTWLNKYPINLAASCPLGSISNSGSSPSITTTVVFDPSCININTGNTALGAGDLILLQNNSGGCGGSNSVVASMSCDSDNPGSSMALRTITSFNLGANTIVFAPGDAFGLNGKSLPAGTITATRIWMISYYIDNSTPARPQLMRQVNLNAAQPVGDVIENLQIFYDMLNPSATPPALLSPTEQENPASANLPSIRDAYIFLFARSQNQFLQTKNYVRNNLEAVVSVRGLDYFNEFN